MVRSGWACLALIGPGPAELLDGPLRHGSLPKSYPKGGLPLKRGMKFLSGQRVATTYEAPCPKKK